MRQTSEIAKILALNIKTQRERLRLNQLELAIKIGVSEPTVTAWETGRRWPGLENIISLADVFGVPESSLYIDQSAQGEELHRAARAIIRAVHERPYQDVLDALARVDENKMNSVRMILGILDSKSEQKVSKKKL